MIILHPWMKKRRLDMAETWRGLHQIRKRYTVIDRLHSPDQNAYDDVIAEYWGKDDLIVCEMDKVPTLEHIESFANCTCDVGSYLYAGLDGSAQVWDNGKKYYCNDNPMRGLVKFSKAIQVKTAISEWYTRDHWIDIDRRIWTAISRHMPTPYFVHVHGAVTHNHGLDRARQILKEAKPMKCPFCSEFFDPSRDASMLALYEHLIATHGVRPKDGALRSVQWLLYGVIADRRTVDTVLYHEGLRLLGLSEFL